VSVFRLFIQLETSYYVITSPAIEKLLNAGTAVICDRYAFSGIAFSASKVTADGDPLLSFEWCKSPDIGLPAPDLVLFLDITPEKAKERGGYGEERYEKEEMQMRVRKFFHRIGGEEMVLGDENFSARWVTVDAGRDRDAVAKDVWTLVGNLVAKGVKFGPVQKLWSTEN
jgi:dTMP kinase